MVDFSTFRKSQNKQYDSIISMKEKVSKPSYVDERFWKLSMDKMCNGEAIIRFLPQKDVEAHPIVLQYGHSFQYKGKWFIENCPTTIDESCPICEYAQPFWNMKTEHGKKMGGMFGRKKHYIANILVVRDPKNPENEGKVFLFKFGVGIFDKVMAKLAPTSELSEPEMIHNMWEGKNFQIISKKKDDYPNYDTSSFKDEKTPIADSDEKIEKIWNQLYDLSEFLDPKIFKGYEELEKKLFTIVTPHSHASSSSESEDMKEPSKKAMKESKKPDADETDLSEDNSENDDSVGEDDFDFNEDDFNFED